MKDVIVTAVSALVVLASVATAGAARLKPGVRAALVVVAVVAFVVGMSTLAPYLSGGIKK